MTSSPISRGVNPYNDKLHELKTWPLYFEAVVSGRKTFEIRLNDRGFQVGDTLHLREWDPATEQYTGRIATRLVHYLITDGAFGIEPGYVVMGIRP